MKLLNWLERRFGAWSIPEFPLFIVCATGAIFLLSQARPDFLYQVILDPEAIHQGEWWRLMTFLFVPPAMGPLWLVFWLYLIYQYAQALEAHWGHFHFLVFYIIGALSTIGACLWVGETLSNMPLYTSLFLAFAGLYPDFEVLLFFILPVKVKYLAFFVWVGVIWSFIDGTPASRAGVAASLVNYALFFGSMHYQQLRLRWEVYRNRRRTGL